MNIVPSSTIHLLKNVPLDPDFQHSIRFTSPSAQVTYFGSSSLHVQSFNRQSYQRYAKGTLRVSALADDLLQCNYMCFQNTGHSGNAKWFYAFILSVDYINENTTEIKYEIDPIQTYMFDYSLGYCFVEREHAEEDSINYQLVPEDLECGEYINTWIAQWSFGKPEDQQLVAYTTYDLYSDQDDLACDGYVANQGLFSGLGIQTFPLYDPLHPGTNRLKDVLLGASSAYKSQFISDLYVCPTMLGNLKSYDFEHDQITGGSDKYFVYPMAFSGYVPRNKKLFTAPYCQIMLDDNQGTRAKYNLELFGRYDQEHQDRIHFILIGQYLPKPTIAAIPTEYKGNKYNWSERMIISNFPTCTWNSDTYNTWLAENRNKLGTSATLFAGSLVAGVMTKNPTMVATGISGIAGIIAQKKDKSFDPYVTKGEASGDGTMYGLKRSGIDIYFVHITATLAQIIDNFFDVYGYAVHKVKLPNLFGGGTLRPKWNYLKTINCQLEKNNCPADDAKKICSIYDNGITFWNNPSEVADYSNPDGNRPQEGT